MAQFTAADIKPHLVIAPDVTGEDGLIDDYIVAAEDWVKEYLRRDLDDEFGASWPEGCRQAVRMIVADYYYNKGAVIVGPSVTVLDTVKQTLSVYRNLSGT